MNVLEILNWRYATKRMNGQNVPADKLDRILEAARLAPSSYGLQPYSVLVVKNKDMREKISPLALSQPQITECSHLLIFATWDCIEVEHVEGFIRMLAEQRNISQESLEGYKNTILRTVRAFATQDQKRQWAARQAYIALGMTLVAAAAEQVDASPMEGFDPVALDELLGLRVRNLRSAVLVALGYRDSVLDGHAGLTKVRRPRGQMLFPLG